LNTRRITKSYARKDWSKEMRDAILLREGLWLGSAYAIRSKAVPLESFETLIAQHPAVRSSYLDMTLGPFIVASNPNCRVGFVDEVLFKHRAHGSSSRSSFSSISVERALRTVEICKSVDATTYHLIADVLTDKRIERRYSDLRKEMELLELQYTGQKLKAISKFISLSPYLFRKKQMLHEFMRLAATTICGAESFIRWNTKRKSK
jgi:hypothetical protein